MEIQVLKRVDCGLPVKDNAFWRVLKNRTAFVLNPDTAIEPTSLCVFTVDRNVIFRRRLVDSLKMESVDGDILITSPMMPDDIKKKKDTSTFFMLNDQIIIEYWFQGDHADERADLARKSVVDTLAKVLGKEIITTPTCDILVDQKKIAGSSIHRNKMGVHDGLTVTYLYDKEIFKKYLDDDRDSESQTGYGITGVYNENPACTVDQFLEEYVSIFKTEFERLNPNDKVLIER